MAMVEINNEVFQYQFTEGINLQKLLPIVRSKYSFENYNYTSIALNGLTLIPEIDKMSLLRPLTQTDFIQLTLDGNPYLDLIENLEKLSSSITLKITKMDYSSQVVYESDLNQILAGISVFIQTSTYIVRRLKNRYNQIDDSQVKNLQIHLLSVLKGIESAHNMKDLVMLEDLLEFELKDNLTKWKILVIPSLKVQIKKPH